MSSPINNIARTLQPLSLPTTGPLDKTASAVEGPKEGVGELFSDMMRAVSDLHTAAGDSQQALLRGDPVELHQVVIAGSKAGIATDLLLEIRNRVVDGFNEIMRMPM